MQRPFLSQSPKRVGSGPPRPPTSGGAAGCAETTRSCNAPASPPGVAATVSRWEGVSTGWAFGTGANSARIGRFRLLETPAKTKMSTPGAIDLSAAPHGLGVLAFRGTDTVRFLQGQFSPDVEKLA